MTGYPLAVTLDDHRNPARDVTDQTSGLTFNETCPGGHAEGSMVLRGKVADFPALGPLDVISVSDTRTGDIIYEGYCSPRQSVSNDGQGFVIDLRGGMSRAADAYDRLVYVDQRLSEWEEGKSSRPAMTTSVGRIPNPLADDSVDALLLQFPSGTQLVYLDFAEFRYNGFLNANGQFLGGWGGYTVWGSTDDEAWATLGPNGLSGLNLHTLTESVGAVRSVSPRHTPIVVTPPAATGVDFPDGSSYIPKIWLQCQIIAGRTVGANENIWAAVTGIWVRGRMRGQDGVGIAGPGTYQRGSVLASEVFADLLGRGLMQNVWNEGSEVQATSYLIDQLVYDARVSDMLSDLLRFEPDWFWQILARGRNGQHSARGMYWPTEPRYSLPDTGASLRVPDESQLANRVMVRWTSTRGKPKSQLFASSDFGYTVPTLDDAGVTRGLDPIDLPDGHGSTGNAARAAQVALKAASVTPMAGAVTVDSKVRDLYTGAMVYPHEIKTGYPAVMSDGVVLRITERSFSMDSMSAAVTLGRPGPRTLEEMFTRWTTRTRG